MGAGEVWVLIPLAAILMWGARGIVTAIAGGRHATRPQVPPGSDDEVKAELDALRQRVTELEERQDFAERVLARGSREGEDRNRAS
jgi:hypothetical protein